MTSLKLHVLLLSWAVTDARATHYATLGVSESATADEIKTAYRKLALKHRMRAETRRNLAPRVLLAAHEPSAIGSRSDPDKNPTQASDEMFKRLTEAHEVLSDPVSRRRYDMQRKYGAADESSRMPAAGAQYYYSSFGSARGYPFGVPGFGGVPGDGGPFRSRPRVPPPRAQRPFYCTFAELADGCTREFVLRDGPVARVCDAWSELRGPTGVQGVVGAALWKVTSIAASVCWRFPRLCFGRRWWWVRLPVLALAFLAALAQQLPRSPNGTYRVDVKPEAAWRHGTRIVFQAKGDSRAVAFEMRERRDPRIRRKSPPASGDLLVSARASFRRARKGTRITISDVHGERHHVQLRLTDEEADERPEHVLRKVGHGLGLPRKAGSRGDLWARVTLGGAASSASKRRGRL